MKRNNCSSRSVHFALTINLSLKAKILSAKPMWNGFLLVTVRALNSYEEKQVNLWLCKT